MAVSEDPTLPALSAAAASHASPVLARLLEARLNQAAPEGDPRSVTLQAICLALHIRVPVEAGPGDPLEVLRHLEETAILGRRAVQWALGRVEAWSGEVVGYHRATLLAVWFLEGEEVQPGLARAIRCASDLAWGQDSALGETLPLRGVGVSVGPVQVVRAGGGDGRWFPLVLGEAVREAQEAACREPARVILAREAWERAPWGSAPRPWDEQRALSPEDLERLPDPEPVRVPVAAPPPQGALDLLWEATRQRLEEGAPEWQDEWRHGTALGLWFKLPPDPRSWPLAAHRALLSLQGVLVPGHVRLQGAWQWGEGIQALGVLGIPEPVPGSHPVTGAALAWQVQGIPGFDLPLRSACTTGHIFCGIVGTASRRLHVLEGPVIHGLDTLLDMGTGPFCDRETSRLASHRLRMEPVQAQGRTGEEDAEASVAWRIAGPQHPSRILPALGPIHGREEELRILRRAMEALKLGQSRVLLLQGDAGIGKTRLLAEAVHEAEDLGIQVLVGAGDILGGKTAFLPWSQILEEFFSLQEGDSPATRMDKVSLVLSELTGSGELAALLNPVLRTGFPESSQTRGLEGPARVERMMDLLGWLMQLRAQESPLMVILEDAHLADSASWTLAWRLTTWVKPFLMVLATRPLEDPVPSGYRQLLRVPGTSLVHVQSLSFTSIVEMICEILDVETCPLPLSTWVSNLAEGSPFFARELVLYLRSHPEFRVQSRQVASIPRRIHQDPLAPFPAQSIAAWRVGTLDSRSQRVLKVASALGVDFSVENLVALDVWEGDVGWIGETVEGLVRADMLVRRDEASVDPLPGSQLPPASRGTGIHTFLHQLLHQTVYATFTSEQRRRVHRSIALLCERRVKEGVALPAALLAHHWVESGDLEHSWEYLARAGTAAFRGNALPEAIHFWNKALELEERALRQGARPDPERKARWLARRGEALFAMGTLDEARRSLETALVHLGFPFPPAQGGQVFTMLVHFLRQASHAFLPEWAVRTFGTGRARLVEAAHVTEILSEACFYEDQVRWVTAILVAANLLDAAGRPYASARPYAEVGFMFGTLRLQRVAERYFKRAEEAGNLNDDWSGLSVTRYVRAAYHLNMGRLGTALEWVEGALEAARRGVDHHALGMSLSMKGMTLYFSSAFAAGRTTYEELQRVGRANKNGQHAAWGSYGAGMCTYRQGQLQAAETSILESLPSLTEAQSLLICAATLAILRESLGRGDEARESFDEAEALIGKLPGPIAFPALEGYWGVAIYRLLLWRRGREGGLDRARMRGLRKRALSGCRGVSGFAWSHPYSVPRAHIAMALGALYDGKPERGRKLLLQAISSAVVQQAPLEEAMAWWVLGSSLLPQPSPDHRARGLAGFQRLGIPLPADLALVVP